MKAIILGFTIIILTSYLPAETGSTVIQLAAGDDHTCVLTDNMKLNAGEVMKMANLNHLQNFLFKYSADRKIYAYI